MRVRLIGAAVVTLAALVSVTACGSDDTETGGRHIEPESVVSGEVSRSGVPVAGLEVSFQAWPRDEVLDELADGESFELLQLGHVVTDADGWFAFGVDVADIDEQYVRDDGWLDVEITFGNGDALWNFTAIPNTSGAGEGLWTSDYFSDADFAVRASDGKAPMHLFVDLDADPQIVEDGNDPADWDEEPPAEGA